MQRKINTALQPVTSSFPVLVPATAADVEGIFSDAGTKHLPRAVRTVSEKEVDDDVTRMRREPKYLGVLTRKQWMYVQGINLLKRATDHKDRLAIEKACSLLCDYNPDADPEPGCWVPAPPALLAETLLSAAPAVRKVLTADFFSRPFYETRLVYWIKAKTKPFPMGLGLYCPDLKAAFVVTLLLRDTFRICPRCQKTFRAKHTEQVCCSVKCREAHRIARWRARQKKEGR
jgi:hypothetical protein